MSASGRRTREMQRLSPTSLRPAGVRPARDRSGLAAHRWRSPLCSHTSSLLAGAQIGAWALESTAPEAVRGCTRPQASGRSREVPFGQRLPVATSRVVGSGLHCPQPTLGSVTPERVQTWFTQSLGEKCRLVIFIRTLQDYKVLLVSPPISTLDVICLYHLPSFLLDSFS